MVSVGNCTGEFFRDHSANKPHGDSCSMGSGNCSERGEKDAISVENIWIPEYPAGQMGYWFRPLIAGGIADGKISGRKAFILLQGLMEASDEPRILKKFERLCMWMIGAADLRTRLKMMEEAYNNHKEAYAVIEGMKSMEGLPEDLMSSMVEKLSSMREKAIKRVESEIQAVKQMINREDSDAGKTSCH